MDRELDGLLLRVVPRIRSADGHFRGADLKGRTARDLLIGTSILPPIATTVWFAVLGGTGIYVDQKAPGAVTGPLADDGLPPLRSSRSLQNCRCLFPSPSDFWC